jgi:hypothetical protein
MELIPAPGRAFRTWSMWLLIATGIFDLAVLLLKTLTDLHVMTAETVLIVNAVLAFATGVVRLIQQQIALTTEQKVAVIESAASQPMKPGEENVAVKIDGETVPSTPQAANP